MKTKVKKYLSRLGIIAATAIAPVWLAACSSDQSQKPQPIAIDGSSTVYPITEAVTEKFNSADRVPVEVTVGFSGTGGGFKKFCDGKTDINNASRPIKREEMAACKQQQVAYIELPVGFDALTVVVNSQNNWANDITVAELKKIWEPGAQKKITNWNQVRSSWPNKPLNLYGPGKDSGTYDYFTEAIVGKAGSSRTDYFPSEDDEIIREKISQDPNALGFFGYAYYEAHKDQLKALAIDRGKGPVRPSAKAVEAAKYQPLARPLFIYVNAEVAQKNPAMVDFVDFYMKNAARVVNDVGYVAFSPRSYNLLYQNFYQMKVGTVYGGKSEFDLTIEEVLKKQAEF